MIRAVARLAALLFAAASLPAGAGESNLCASFVAGCEDAAERAAAVLDVQTGRDYGAPQRQATFLEREIIGGIPLSAVGPVIPRPGAKRPGRSVIVILPRKDIRRAPKAKRGPYHALLGCTVRGVHGEALGSLRALQLIEHGRTRLWIELAPGTGRRGEVTLVWGARPSPPDCPRLPLARDEFVDVVAASG